jgi:hypothetical protein
VAWYKGNSSAGTKAVGTKAANELGIHDMSGNVAERCRGLTATFGGCWLVDASLCAIVSNGAYFYSGGGYIGFRLARSSGN